MNLFDTPRMAAGYANWRPPVHPHVIALIRDRLQIATPVRRALDVGSGAGLSTAPLRLLGSLDHRLVSHELHNDGIKVGLYLPGRLNIRRIEVAVDCG